MIYSYLRCTDNQEFQAYITRLESEASRWDEPELIWDDKGEISRSAK